MIEAAVCLCGYLVGTDLDLGDTCSHDVSWISARVAICACTRTDGTLTRIRTCINLIRSCTRTGLTLYLYWSRTTCTVKWYWSRTNVYSYLSRTNVYSYLSRTNVYSYLSLTNVFPHWVFQQHEPVSWVVIVLSCYFCLSYRILRHQSAIIILTITTITTTTTASPEPE